MRKQIFKSDPNFHGVMAVSSGNTAFKSLYLRILNRGMKIKTVVASDNKILRIYFKILPDDIS